MADQRISELTDYESPISTDVLPIVDVTANTTKKISISSLRGSLINSGQATVNFGANTQEDSIARVTVNNTNAYTSSIIIITPSGASTDTHDPDDYQWDNISGYATNIVDGVSFDIVGVAPCGAFGDYKFNYVIN